MKSVLLRAATVALLAGSACGDPMGPEVEVTFVGAVDGLTSDMPPATIAAEAHADDGCVAGPVVATASTETHPGGTYRFTLSLPRNAVVCVAVTVEVESGGSVYTARTETRVPIVVAGGTVTLSKGTIRIVIPRPKP